MTQRNTQQIVEDYDYPYQGNLITEEEFVYDSLKNDTLFQMLENTNLKLLHLRNEGHNVWDDPNEVCINVGFSGEGDDEPPIATEDTDKIEVGGGASRAPSRGVSRRGSRS